MQTFKKIAVYAHLSHLHVIIDTLRSSHINNIGEYSNCLSYYEVESSWTASDKASPYIGEKDSTTIAKEYKIEFLCDIDKFEEIAALIKDVHPYEEPVIEIWDVCCF